MDDFLQGLLWQDSGHQQYRLTLAGSLLFPVPPYRPRLREGLGIRPLKD